LGIDPSLNSSGIAIVSGEKCWAYVLKPGKLRDGKRLKYQMDRLKEILAGFGEISSAGIEGPAYEAATRADDMGQIRGAYLYVLEDLGIETVTKLPPTSVKKYATGNGSASKEVVLAAAKREWPETTFETDDASDAAWMAAIARALQESVPVTPAQNLILRGISLEKKKAPEFNIRKNNI
jgi:Holliday junction resolvasome RuvABC endonuclease subunit